MEILNKLWLAISMPNEGLLNIITIPIFLVESYVMLSLFTAILNILPTKKQKIVYIVLTSFISILSNYILPDVINIFINYILVIIIVHFVFKISFFKSTASLVASGLIFNVLGALILNPYLKLLNIEGNQLTSIPMYRLLYMAIIYSIIGLLIFIIKNQKWKITFIDNIDKKSKLIISINLLLGIVTLLVQTFLAIYYIDILPMIITFFTFISLTAYLILSIYTLTRVFKLTLTTQKLQSAKEYNNTLRILHDNVRGFKHDFDNIVTTIGGYVRTNDMEGLKKYYVQLEDDCQRVNNLYILNPDIVNNDGIYNLLTKKYNDADSKDIKVNITFLLDLSTLQMKIYEFARILGILLDNAIEASSECEENKIINITLRNDAKNSRQLVIIENTFINNNIDTEKIFEKGFSGKENHTGLGLWEVRKLIKKNKNINLHTSNTDKFFTQQLEIYY